MHQCVCVCVYICISVCVCVCVCVLYSTNGIKAGVEGDQSLPSSLARDQHMMEWSVVREQPFQ